MKYRHDVIEGDQNTPISIYSNLTGNRKFLLESSLKHEDNGRFSFIGANPFYEFIAYGNQITETDLINEQSTTTRQDPLIALNALIDEQVTLDIEIPFFAGGVGYLAYDLGKQFESIGINQHDDANMPDVHLMFYEKVVVYDHLLQNIHCFIFDRWITGESIDFETEANRLLHDIQSGQPEDETAFTLGEFQSNFSQAKYKQYVDLIKERIKAGDVFQTVLSQRLTATCSGDAFQFYRQLRKQNPSPYMYYIDFVDYQIIGASPESLVKAQDRTVSTNPIAGTRKRGQNPDEDQALADELLADEKEIAEHQMLVDLGRHDIGRIAKPGTITLTKYMVIERYRFVMHIVSEVSGQMNPDISSLEALKATLPAGTVSGAPKIRAMQLLNDLEPTKRGAYSGAVGYLNINGNLDFALAIRTMIIKDGLAHVQAGAGVVHDSDPESEYQETLNKAKALMEVL
ncbi:anthranilate synthase component I [Alkalibacillus almallahensis]|uniref:anthranilate synthase component I n=1 Tax=Alkalibacillus almallahensis TaxID=1379154 RepID=UPI0014237473|nr:anthranilate synthase component I [Alkalibacillus almallahensis]NIK12069.1 anthranilate synthase component 1 [Alkalibacillus almallahensis]